MTETPADPEIVLSGAKAARKIVEDWVTENLKGKEQISLGLPEIDDRYEIWRVPLVAKNHQDALIGEVKLGMDGKIVGSTSLSLLKQRVEKLGKTGDKEKSVKTNGLFHPAAIPNKVILGEAMVVLDEFPRDTAQLMITSPPYFNAKTQYSEYLDYQEYLDFIRKVMVRVHAVLSEGRFIAFNTSPVLMRRTSRSTASKRIPIPFDLHKVIESVGFEFVDDIIWVKPEGAGWSTGRGRRFAADRQPLQYKPVPVTEYVMIYRKVTDKLIDWNIRNHYDQQAVKDSKITGEYDVTNVWKIPPARHKIHPAVFPDELVRRLIRYYSFKGDMVLDPFAGSGTVGRVAYEMGRRFLLIDHDPLYYKVMKETLQSAAAQVRVDFEVHESVKVPDNNDSQ